MQDYNEFLSTISENIHSSICYDADKDIKFYQREISGLYQNLFKSLYKQFPKNTTQSQLFSMILMMMQQNINLGINLELSVWDHFYHIYYSTPMVQYQDDFICELLSTYMLKPGSNCQPDIQTFEVILDAIHFQNQNHPYQ